MSKRRHSRHPASQWQAWVDEQAHSGLSQQAFCRQAGIPVSSFKLWKRRLAGEAPMPYHAAAEPALFAPVSMPTAEENDDADDEPRGWEIELDLGDGVCLRFRRGA